MTTYELMREGEWTTDGRLCTPGTITWREDKIPVLGRDYARLGSIIGVLSNLRREGNLILGDTDAKVPAGKVLTTDCEFDKAKAREVAPGRIEMTDLVIRAVHVSEPEQYPWSNTEEEKRE